jgi:hypothetical protein
MNINNISLDKLKVKNSIRDSYKILYNDTCLELNLDYFATPFGLERMGKNYCIKISIDNQLSNFVEALEEKLIDLLSINKEELITNLRKDSKFPPLLTCKIVNRYNKFEGDFRYEDGEFFNIFNLKKNDNLKMSVVIDSIWHINDYYYYKWKISSVKLKK